MAERTQDLLAFACASTVLAGCTKSATGPRDWIEHLAGPVSVPKLGRDPDLGVW
jgi:hypothetical protein